MLYNLTITEVSIYFRNLLSRMTFDEKKHLWKIEGPISQKEHAALHAAADLVDMYGNGELVLKGDK